MSIDERVGFQACDEPSFDSDAFLPLDDGRTLKWEWYEFIDSKKQLPAFVPREYSVRLISRLSSNGCSQICWTVDCY